MGRAREGQRRLSQHAQGGRQQAFQPPSTTAREGTKGRPFQTRCERPRKHNRAASLPDPRTDGPNGRTEGLTLRPIEAPQPPARHHAQAGGEQHVTAGVVRHRRNHAPAVPWADGATPCSCTSCASAQVQAAAAAAGGQAQRQGHEHRAAEGAAHAAAVAAEEEGSRGALRTVHERRSVINSMHACHTAPRESSKRRKGIGPGFRLQCQTHATRKSAALTFELLT